MNKTKTASDLFAGHWFDMATARRNILHLTAIFCSCEFVIKHVASEGRNLLGWDQRDHPLELLFDDNCVTEVSRLLIEIAITIRIIDDMDSHNIVSIDFPVGSVKEGTNHAVLSLREACNKIIHTKQIEFDVGGGLTTYIGKEQEEITECISYIRPSTLELRGKKSGNEWVADLEIMPFVKAATMVTYRYDDALEKYYEAQAE